MKIDSRYFGEVEIEDEKIIHFEQGIFGFEEYKDYVILYDNEGEGQPFFLWLQSVAEKGLAFPIVNPFRVKEDYNPIVDDALLEVIGKCKVEELQLYLLATVPGDVKKASVNMKAPLVINTLNCQGIQLIVENEDYEIKHMLVQNEE